MLEKKNVTEPLNHADQGSVPTFSPDRLPVDDGKKPLSQYILSNDKTEILDNLEKTTDSDKIYHYLDPADSTGGLSPHLQTRLKSCVSPLTSAKSDSNIERPPAWERIDYPFYDFGYSENTQNPESTQNNEALSVCFSGNKTTLSSPDEDPGFLEDTGPVPDSETLISPVPASVPFTDKAKNINNTGCDNCASNIVHAGSTMGVDRIDNRVTNGTEIIQESETGFPPDDIEDLIKTRSPKEISGIVKNSASVNKANLSLTQNSDLSDKENLPAGIALQGNTVPNSPIMSQISPKNQEISEPGNLFQTPKNINPENQKTQNDLPNFKRHTPKSREFPVIHTVFGEKTPLQPILFERFVALVEKQSGAHRSEPGSAEFQEQAIPPENVPLSKNLRSKYSDFLVRHVEVTPQNIEIDSSTEEDQELFRLFHQWAQLSPEQQRKFTSFVQHIYPDNGELET